MKTAILITTTLLVAQPLAVSADNLSGPVLAAQPLAVAVDSLDGPVELDAHGLDAVTAGSGVSVPPSASIQALSDAVGEFVITTTKTTATVRSTPIPQGFGNLQGWLNVFGGTSFATAVGGSSPATATSVSTTPEAALSQAINPSSNTISYDRVGLNSQISVFAQYCPTARYGISRSGDWSG